MNKVVKKTEIEKVNDTSISISNSYRTGTYALAPTNMLKEELSGVYGSQLLEDLNKIIGFYTVYEKGADFNVDAVKDFTPSQLKFKHVKSLINKESRFMFSQTPSFTIKTNEELKVDATEEAKKAFKKKINDTQAFLDEVLKKNKFGIKLLRGSKDCFIGKRIGIFVDFLEDGISISIAPSLEFVYETDEDDVDKLVKVIRFWAVNDSYQRTEQRIFRKKYWIAEDGLCHIQESMYDGTGKEVSKEDEIKTGLSEIPVYVVVNDGLSGDPMGESEVEALQEYEEYYSKLANGDIDSLRKGMNQVVYIADADPDSTKGLSRAPGSFWDIASSIEAMERGKTATVGTVENAMEYSTALDLTLKRIKSTMYETLDMPETNAESLKGVVTSGKTLKAIYWGLMTRCNEKWHVWKAALEWLANIIIEGSKVYGEVRKVYNEKGNLLDAYEIEVENSYPILEDELDEKNNDMAEVTAKVRSKKSYMKKWNEFTDEEAQEEIDQIIEENEMEDSYAPPASDFNNNPDDNLDDEGNPIPPDGNPSPPPKGNPPPNVK